MWEMAIHNWLGDIVNIKWSALIAGNVGWAVVWNKTSSMLTAFWGLVHWYINIAIPCESISLLQVGSLLIILAGVYIVNKPQRS